MIKFLLAFAFLAPATGWAETTIDITFFQSTNLFDKDNEAAEVCGVVTQNPVVTNQVLVIADPGNGEGHYMVNLTPDGNFCHIIRTRYGQVKVKVLDTSRSLVAEKTSFHKNSRRIKK